MPVRKSGLAPVYLSTIIIFCKFLERLRSEKYLSVVHMLIIKATMFEMIGIINFEFLIINIV